MDPLLRPPIGFAHRGARAHAPENTIEAFRLALKLGATGIESDVWLTADGVPVLHHDGVARVGRPRRRPIAELARHQLPAHVPTLEELYDACGTGFHLSLDVTDPKAAKAVVTVADGFGATGSLWLCHPEWRELARWRALSEGVRLVDSTRLRRIREGPERRAATLANAGIDAVNLHHTDWTGGLTTLFHRFARCAFAWDCQHDRVLSHVLAMGMDGVFSDHVDRMTEALERSRR
ncbi:MAG: glycerophosphodiester phosphodiesterase [Actinomycetota bacterium]|nr:glycerophosphodiester phosphodiesterase [Actinomycetota bacterium]